MKFFDFDRVLATIYERKNESFLTFRQIFFFWNELKSFPDCSYRQFTVYPKKRCAKMSLFEHDDNAIGQTEAISNIYATVIPSNSIPHRPTPWFRPIHTSSERIWTRKNENDRKILINVSFWDSEMTIIARQELNRMWNCYIYSLFWENSEKKQNLTK